MKQSFAVTLMKVKDKYYILTNRDNSIAAFTSVDDGLARYQNLYNEKHHQSYEGSMSACINYITFQPAIVLFQSIDELREKLLSREPRVHNLSHVSGFMSGILADTQKAAKIWEQADKPNLITCEQKTGV